MQEFNPYQAPATETAVIGINDGSRESLRKVATYQRGLLACIGLQIVFAIANVVLGDSLPPLLTLIASLALIAVGLAGTVFIFLLAQNVYSTGIAILLTILGLIPCIGLVILVIVNAKATRILRQNGLKVGFLGADPSTI